MQMGPLAKNHSVRISLSPLRKYRLNHRFSVMLICGENRVFLRATGVHGSTTAIEEVERIVYGNSFATCQSQPTQPPCETGWFLVAIDNQPGRGVMQHTVRR